MSRKTIIALGVVFGALLIFTVGPALGAPLPAVAGAVLNILLFPLHLWGAIFLWVTGTPAGQTPYGLLFLALSLPVTYGLLAWLGVSLQKYVQSRR